MSSSPCSTPKANTFPFNINSTPPTSTTTNSAFNFFFPRIPPPQALPVCHIAALPTELLRHVFTLTSLSTVDSAMEVSQVSKRWRAVALSTTALWNSIDILGEDCHKPTESKYSLAKLFLSRATTGPLKVNIYVAIPPQHKKVWDEDKLNSIWFGPKDMLDILSWLVPASLSSSGSLRWTALAVIADTFAPIHTFLSTTSHLAAPNLEQVRLVRCNPYHAEVAQFHPPELQEPIKFLSGGPLPKLRDVCLDGVHVDWDHLASSNINNGIENLTLNFHAGEVKPPVVPFLALISSPRLASLTLHGSGPLTPPASPVLLPALTELKMKYHSPLYAAHLLAALHTPLLQKLHLGDVTRTGPEYGLPGAARASSAIVLAALTYKAEQMGSLDEMWFTDVDAPLDAFLALFKTPFMATLQKLGLKDMPAAPLVALVDGVLLPHLTDIYTLLTISTGRNHDEKTPAIVDVCKTRSGVLKRVHYHYTEVGMVSEEVLDTLEELVEVRSWGQVQVDEEEQEEADEDGEGEEDDEEEDEEEDDEAMAYSWQDEIDDDMDESVVWDDVVEHQHQHQHLAQQPVEPEEEYKHDYAYSDYDDDEDCPESTDGASTSDATTLSGYPSTSASLCDPDEDHAQVQVQWSFEDAQY